MLQNAQEVAQAVVDYSFTVYNPGTVLSIPREVNNLTVVQGCNCVYCQQEREKKEEQEAVMADNYYQNTEAYAQRQYLQNRLRETFWEKSKDSENLFGLRDDDPPSTGTEIVARIKAGMFMLQKYDPDMDDSEEYIRWRDPATKQDRAGHREFIEKLEKLMETARDEIAILPPEKGLETLKAFEGTTVQ